MTMFDFQMGVMTHPRAVAITALDAAVLAAHGFSTKKDLLAQLLALNQEVAAKIEDGSSFTVAGVPKNYPDARKLVTEELVEHFERWAKNPDVRDLICGNYITPKERERRLRQIFGLAPKETGESNQIKPNQTG